MVAQTYFEPQTIEEWQLAADLAEACLALDSAREYGLVTGGPVVNVDRCEQLIRLAAAEGVEPAEDAVPRCLDIIAQGEAYGLC